MSADTETPRVYLLRAYDRDYGARVVAVVAESADAAVARCRELYYPRRPKIEIHVEDECPVEDGQHATLTYEE